MKPRFGSAASIYGCATEAEYREKHAVFCARNRTSIVAERRETVMAYLNNGRWVADCLCGAGMGAYPGWASRCFGCGAIYVDVIFPTAWEDGEDVIWERPRVDHEWANGKTVTDLISENEAAGVSVPERLKLVPIVEEPI
jgi:hypothetical protein